jgi:hypothetical protein
MASKRVRGLVITPPIFLFLAQCNPARILLKKNLVGTLVEDPLPIGQNATKALAHVLRLPGNDILPCQGIIPKSYLLSYRDLYHRYLKESCVHQKKKSVMTDGIENIQEMLSVAMLAANTNKKNKHGMLV